MDETLLVLSQMGIPLYSARGIEQTLTLIPASASIRQTVNGRLINVAPSQFQKYSSSILCRDQRVPAVDGVFPGMLLTVDCVCELAYQNTGGPTRPVVPGSSRVEGAFTFYRPRLNMMVVSHRSSTEEWAAQVSWSIDLVEDLVA